MLGLYSLSATNALAAEQTTAELKTAACSHKPSGDKQAENEAIQYNSVLNKLKQLPQGIQKSLLYGLDLNIRNLLIFTHVGRDKAYLFNPEKPALPNSFMQNFRATLNMLSECPESDFNQKNIRHNEAKEDKEEDKKESGSGTENSVQTQDAQNQKDNQ